MTLGLTKSFYETEYHLNGKSWGEIAKDLHTYPNKVKRDALKLGVKSKPQSKAQVDSLSRGTRKHPTKGTHRSKATKLKISEQNHTVWNNLTDEEREARSQTGKDLWAKRTQEDKDAMHKKAQDAIRRTSKEGSHLEKYLHEEMLKAGFDQIQYHKEHAFLGRERLQLDFLLPTLSVAIEVDGPSHERPVWGQKSFDRNQRADKEKSSVLLARGYVFIRVKQTRRLSQKFKRDISQKLIESLKSIQTKFPDRDHRYIEIIL